MASKKAMGKARRPEFAPMEDFGKIVTGLSATMRAKAAMAGESLGPPSEAQRRAWSAIVSPELIALAGMLDEESDPEYAVFFHGVRKAGADEEEQREEQEAGGVARRHYKLSKWDEDYLANKGKALDVIAVGYPQEALEAIAAAVGELAQEVSKVSGGEPFKRAGRAFAPMLATEGVGGLLAYPLLNYGLRPAKVLHEGGKMPAAAAVPLALNAEIQQLANFSTVEWLSNFVGPQQAQEAQSHVKKAQSATKHFEYAPGKIGIYAGIAAAEPGGRAVNADVDLPSISSYGDPLEEGRLGAAVADGSRNWPGGAWGGRYGRKAAPRPNEMEYVSSAALGALGLALSEEAHAAPEEERHARLSLIGGPLAQARGSWGSKLHVDVGRCVSSGAALAAAIQKVDKGEADLMAEEVGVNAFALRKCLMRMEGNPEKVALALGEAAKGSESAARAGIGKKYDGLARSAMEPGSYSFGGEGPGLEGLSKMMAKADPRLGVAQWAARAVAIASNYGEFAGGERKFDRSGGRGALIDALRRFGEAIAEARRAFAAEAKAQAALAEAAWVDKQGLRGAWDQAKASGSLTGKSLAWAAATPVAASLSSADPMVRLAAGSARALGLPAGGDEELKAGLVLALREMGCDAGGLALLEASDKAREALSEIFAGCVAKDKEEASAARRALPLAAKAARAAAGEGLDGEHAAMFIRTVADRDRLGRGAKSGRKFADGLEEGFKPTAVGGAKAARLVAELCAAKAEHQPALYAALAKDWSATVAASLAAGMGSAQSMGAAAGRCGDFCKAMPNGLGIDWRARPFDAMPAWEAFGMESPSLGAAIEAAKTQGPLGEWCAANAKRLGVIHAADANDLAGKCRDAVKSQFGVGDGAWKAAIKSAETLACLGEALRSDYSAGSRSAELSSKAELPQAELRSISWAQSSDGEQVSDMSRIGKAMVLAAAAGASPESTGAAIRALVMRRGSDALFSSSIGKHEVADQAGAAFYAAEAKAKESRAGRIFQEACKRHAKLSQDFEAAKARGQAELPLPPGEALAGEAADLIDWIGQSEHGVWQTLPADPTWGQLARLSRAWHAEEAAKAADRESMRNAKMEEDRERWKLAPFAPRSSEHWEPIVGRHARDGWEAVELTCQSELSEEGSAMQHCVSGYSPQCRSGELRIFSVRLGGERKCTLELRADGNLGSLGEDAEFKITQNKGKCNIEVRSAATRAFCEEVRKAVQEGWAAKWRATQKLVEQDKERKAQEAARKKAEKKAASQAQGADPEAHEAEQGAPKSAAKRAPRKG